MINFTRLQYVILHDISQRWSDPTVAMLFPQIVDLKLRGYGHDYPPGALAVDTTDFIGTHVLLTEEDDDGGLSLLAGFKWVTLAQCKYYNLEFPPLGFVRAAAATRHEKQLRKIIDGHAGAEKTLAYGASWTARPDLRQDRAAAKNLIQLTMAAHLLSVEEMGIASCVSNGVPRMNSDKIEASAGYVPLDRKSVV